MEGQQQQQQQRGRSASAGRQSNHNNIRHSPSPHHFHDYNSTLNLDSSVANSNYNPVSFSPSSTSPVGPDVQYNLSTQYLDGSLQPPPYQQHVLPSNDFGDLDRKSPYPQETQAVNGQGRPANLNLQQSSHHFNADVLGSSPGNGFGDFETSHPFVGKQTQGLDNSFLLDPQLGDMPQHQSINPADIMSNMSSPQNMMSASPSLMPPETNSSPGQSPAVSQGQFYSPNHSRHASTSLDPSSALNAANQHGDWTSFAGEQFQTHRRAPSEHSDVSSVAPSPFLPRQDSFDAYDQPSPMLNPQQDTQIYQDALGIGQFSISEPQQQQPEQHRISPGHSPFVSPRMSPQPGFPFSHDQFQLSQDMQNGFNGAPAPEMYTNPQDQSLVSYPPRIGSRDMGQAAQMTPPEISVDLAPPSVLPNNFPHQGPENELSDTLSPPNRGMLQLLPSSLCVDAHPLTRLGRGNRIRAKSDTSISRPMTPANGFSPNNPSEYDPHRNRSLSPFGTGSQPSLSRDPSPGAKSRRSSTSSIPSRDYLIGLAGEPRPPGSGDRQRVQKHPATF
ncbi:MAG: hypothetical protein Q9190_008052, partial [Brigantiaea leucoxantha]